MYWYMLYYTSDRYLGLFFMLKNRLKDYRKTHGGMNKCVQESHLPALSAKTVTMIQLRIRRHILTEWRSRSTVLSARSTQLIKKQSNAICYCTLFVEAL
jgi:hypothetical protein